MPTEQEMLPKDKYTIFDRKEKKYRKGIHSTFHGVEAFEETDADKLQSFQSGQDYPNDSTLLVIDRIWLDGLRWICTRQKNIHIDVGVCMVGVMALVYIRRVSIPCSGLNEVQFHCGLTFLYHH